MLARMIRMENRQGQMVMWAKGLTHTLAAEAGHGGIVDLGVCGDLGARAGDVGVKTDVLSRCSSRTGARSFSSCVVTNVEVEDVEGGGTLSGERGMVGLGMGGAGFTDAVCLEGPAWPGLAGSTGGTSVLVFVGDVGLVREDGCMLFVGRGGKRGVKSSDGDICSCCRPGVCRGPGTLATLVCAEP
jgi:hypothetical protein